MNEKAKQYWEGFWQGKEQPQSVVAEQFGYGDEVIDYLAQLIIDGKKTATCSCHCLYELENTPLPTVGLYTIILNSKEDPVAIIRTKEILILKMSEVTPSLAEEEGEGGYDVWYEGHKKFFTRDLEEHGLEYSDDLLVIFERFEVIKC